MAIIYHPNKKIFTLHTAHTTYQMQVDTLGYLLHLYLSLIHISEPTRP